MSKFKVGIDDGHGMETAGKRTCALKEDLKFRGKTFKKGSMIHENDFNENLLELLEKGLDRCGIGHLQLAPGDSDISLANRVKKANSNKCDIVVSLHANALGHTWQTKAHGLVVIHTANCSSKSKTLARNCYNHLSKEVKWNGNGGTKYGVRSDKDISGYTLYILRQTTMPSILIEYGFMDNWEDVKLMVTDKFQRECVEATLKGICETLKVPYKSPTTIAPPKPTTPKPTPSDKPPFKNGSYNRKARVKCKGSSLNVRSGRGAKHTILGKFKDGEIIEVNYCVDNWFSTWSLGKEGYVCGDYIELI